MDERVRMESYQEQLMLQISEASFGAPFVFKPDLYSKGSGIRQPADLGWACNNCLVLMCMQHAVASRQKMYDHNFGQLRGFLRAWWHLGAPLRGRNCYQEFDIKPNEFSHIVLLSVVGGPHATAEYHAEFVHTLRQKGYPVTACATIPQGAMAMFAARGGSTLDLIQFINRLRISNETLGEAQSLCVVEEIFAPSKRHVVLLNGKHIDTDEVLRETRRYLGKLRIQHGEAGKNLDEVGRTMILGYVATVFNDLDWSQIYRLVSCVKEAVIALENGKIAILTAQFLFGNYNLIVDVQSLHRTPDMKQAFGLMDEAPSEGPNSPPILVGFLHAEGRLICYVASRGTKRLGASQTELLLKSFLRSPNC
jgi:hypothetical protein